MMADAGEDGIDAVAVPALEEVAPEPSVLLHVADHRLDGGTALELAFDEGREPALLA